LEYEYYIRSLTDSTMDDDIREDIVEVAVNTRRYMAVPGRMLTSGWTINSPAYMDTLYGEEFIRRMIAEQIEFDMDNEILLSMGVSPKPRDLPKDFEDINYYREEILIKKYGFR